MTFVHFLASLCMYYSISPMSPVGDLNDPFGFTQTSVLMLQKSPPPLLLNLLESPKPDCVSPRMTNMQSVAAAAPSASSGYQQSIGEDDQQEKMHYQELNRLQQINSNLEELSKDKQQLIDLLKTQLAFKEENEHRLLQDIAHLKILLAAKEQQLQLQAFQTQTAAIANNPTIQSLARQILYQCQT